MTDLSELIRLQKQHIEQAADVLSQAFSDDPQLSSIAPGEEKRLLNIRLLSQTIIYHGIRHGEVYTTSRNMEGIAIWLPSSETMMTFQILMYAFRLALRFKTGWRFIWRMKRDDNFTSRLRKRCAPFPHWYLVVIGVDPDFRGKGYSSKLLRPMLARLDKEKLPCYLETENQQYVSLYQHFGFNVIGEGKLPSTKAHFWAMLRESQ